MKRCCTVGCKQSRNLEEEIEERIRTVVIEQVQSRTEATAQLVREQGAELSALREQVQSLYEKLAEQNAAEEKRAAVEKAVAAEKVAAVMEKAAVAEKAVVAEKAAAAEQAAAQNAAAEKRAAGLAAFVEARVATGFRPFF